MKPFGIKALIWGSSLATILAVRGIKRNSLSESGALAAFIVGFLSIASGWRSGLLLIGFYQVGSSATKYNNQVKRTLDATATTASARGASQVFGCSLLATICSVIHAVYYGAEQVIHFDKHYHSSQLACAILAHYACCCADTLASELGILAKRQPRLITNPFLSVPPGTNGGISGWGTLCSIVGGSLMGVICLGTDYSHSSFSYASRLFAFGGVCGFIGSMLDSLLGATLQASYYDLDRKLAFTARDDHISVPPQATHISGYNILTNVQVNLLSTLLTMLFGAYFLGPLLFTIL